ncbi:PEP-CTERM sorting domain-containing protein [Oceaniferula marina]|nr:PEP-CTERM sorting domain-containing protein [Oceaniferula marina]
MKTKHLFMTTCAALVTSAAVQAATSVTNWKTWNNDTTVSSGLNTDSPTFGNGTSNNADGLWYAGKFGSAVTLGIGDTLTVSAIINLTGGNHDTGDNDFRLGIFNDGGQFDANSGENWSAGYMLVPGTDLFQIRTNGAFISTATNAVDLNATKINNGLFRGNHVEDYVFSMSITRDSATTVDIVSSLTRNDSIYEKLYTENDRATSNFTFTAMGGSFGGNLNLDQGSYSNAQYEVTSVPEPSAAALLSFGGVALMMRRRK